MMRGYLVYSEKDVSKNQFFIQTLTSGFAGYGITLELLVYETLSEFPTESLPDFVINRSRFSDISFFYEKRSIPVFNNASVTEITNDKLKTYRFLEDTVPTLPAKSPSDYTSGEFSYPVIIKSCSGHGGSEVFLANSPEEEKEICLSLQGQPYLIQACASDLGKDVRVYILGNQILAAVLRTSTNSFKSNYSLGGSVRQYTLNADEKSLTDMILCKLNLDYAGIDFIFHEGKPVFNEIEDAVGARMLYEVSDIDIASLYVQYIVNKLSK